MAYRRGMGAVWSPDGTDFTFPWYCDVFSAWATGEACTPPTPAQLADMQKKQLAKIAAVNPDLAAKGQAAGDAAVDALKRANPADAAAYQIVIDHPTLASLFGSDIANYLTGTDPNTGKPLAPGTQWMLYGGIALAALLTIGIVRGR